MIAFWKWCRRYVSLMFIAIVAFLLYVLFFSENSYSRYNELHKQAQALKAQIAMEEDTLAYYRTLNKRLETSPAEMERIVREQYFMQRPYEDVYIVE